MGSRAARKLLPGDIIQFSHNATAFTDDIVDGDITDGRTWIGITMGAIGLIIEPKQMSDNFRVLPHDDTDAPTRYIPPGWITCIVDGRAVWTDPTRAKRLNRRSP
jgi:hypothetical protein